MGIRNMMVVHNGIELDVDYDTEGDGSGPSYSPMYGADGGDPLIVIFLEARRIDNGKVYALRDDSIENICAYITEHHEFDDGREEY